MGNTNSNKTMTSEPYNMAQEQQQVQEMILCRILLSLYSSNLYSYSNLPIATDICIKQYKYTYKTFMPT